jgi:hypothetical protein
LVKKSISSSSSGSSSSRSDLSGESEDEDSHPSLSITSSVQHCMEFEYSSVDSFISSVKRRRLNQKKRLKNEKKLSMLKKEREQKRGDLNIYQDQYGDWMFIMPGVGPLVGATFKAECEDNPFHSYWLNGGQWKKRDDLVTTYRRYRKKATRSRVSQIKSKWAPRLVKLETARKKTMDFGSNIMIHYKRKKGKREKKVEAMSESEKLFDFYDAPFLPLAHKYNICKKPFPPPRYEKYLRNLNYRTIVYGDWRDIYQCSPYGNIHDITRLSSKGAKKKHHKKRTGKNTVLTLISIDLTTILFQYFYISNSSHK